MKTESTSGDERMNWRCPRCDRINEWTVQKCSCGYTVDPDQQIKYKVEPRKSTQISGTRFKSREEYEAWKAHKIKENLERKRRLELTKIDLNYYYQVLGLKPTASKEEIQQAYEDLAKVWHPDRFSQDPQLQQRAQEKLKEIHDAYEKINAYITEFNEESFQSEIEQYATLDEDTQSSLPPSLGAPVPPGSIYDRETKQKKLDPKIIIGGSVIGLLVVIALIVLLAGSKSKKVTDAHLETISLPPTSSSLSFDEEIKPAHNSIQKNDWQGLLNLSQHLIQTYPDNANGFLYRCMSYNNLREYKKAIESCTQAIRMRPDLAEAYANRGTAYDILGSHQQFISDYTIAARLGYKYAREFLNSKGIAWDKPSQISKSAPSPAQQQRTAKQKQQRFSDEYWYKRGLDFYKSGKYGIAIEEFNKAIQTNPDNPDYLEYRELAYYKSGQYERSIRDFSEVISYQSFTSRHFVNRGRAYLQIAQYRKALSDFQKACNLNDQYGCKLMHSTSDKISLSNR